MFHFRLVRGGSALKMLAVLSLAGMGSSALCSPVLYTFTGVVLGNSDPVNPDGTVQAFTYLSPSGFITSELSVPLAELTSCTGCNSSYPGFQFPVEFAPGFDVFDSIEFFTYNLTPQGFEGTVSQENYSFDLGAFSTLGTHLRASSGGANAATLTVEAVPEPTGVFLIAAALIIGFLRCRLLPINAPKDR